MRVADRPFPTVVAHPMPAAPIRPVIAVEPVSIDYTWDDPLLVWDDPANTWDLTVPAGPWADLYCDYQGMSIESGHPDEHGVFDADHLIVQVDNRTGEWSRYNVDGSLSNYGPGRHIAVWATDGTDRWWLFYGRVARWDEHADDTIEVEAFDLQSDLAQPRGTYTPGTAGQLPAGRMTSILAVAGFTDRRDLNTGICSLTQQATDQSPLEELQTVAASDGGALYGDADGTIVYAGRGWRGGRTDQTAVPAVSDNVCTAGVVVWDPVLSTSDELLADTVILQNVAKLRSTASTSRPSGAYLLTRQGLQYTTQGEGDTLAAFLLAGFSPPRLRVDGFDLYLFDPRQPSVWRAVDWRLFDRLRYVHDSKVIGGVTRLDLLTVIISIDHDVTPSEWIMSVATSRAVDYARPINWDQAPYVWDDPSPMAVWTF